MWKHTSFTKQLQIILWFTMSQMVNQFTGIEISLDLIANAECLLFKDLLVFLTTFEIASDSLKSQDGPAMPINCSPWLAHQWFTILEHCNVLVRNPKYDFHYLKSFKMF